MDILKKVEELEKQKEETGEVIGDSFDEVLEALINEDQEMKDKVSDRLKSLYEHVVD